MICVSLMTTCLVFLFGFFCRYLIGQETGWARGEWELLVIMPNTMKTNKLHCLWLLYVSALWILSFCSAFFKKIPTFYFFPSNVKAFPTVFLVKVRSVWKALRLSQPWLGRPSGQLLVMAEVALILCHLSFCGSWLIDLISVGFGMLLFNGVA